MLVDNRGFWVSSAIPGVDGLERVKIAPIQKFPTMSLLDTMKVVFPLKSVMKGQVLFTNVDYR